MSKTIDFYFDYSSPYGYLASTRIEALADKHGHQVTWRPVLLGAIFKVSNQAPLLSFPLKGDYALMDFKRSAREHKIDYIHPGKFPIGAVAASRATYWVGDNADASVSDKTGEFVKSLYKTYFVDDTDISNTDVVLDTAASIGIDRDALANALGEQDVKDRLRTAVEQAIELGVFGSPMMYVGKEAFWGSDRLDQLDRWLASGGW